MDVSSTASGPEVEVMVREKCHGGVVFGGVPKDRVVVGSLSLPALCLTADESNGGLSRAKGNRHGRVHAVGRTVSAICGRNNTISAGQEMRKESLLVGALELDHRLPSVGSHGVGFYAEATPSPFTANENLMALRKIACNDLDATVRHFDNEAPAQAALSIRMDDSKARATSLVANGGLVHPRDDVLAGDLLSLVACGISAGSSEDRPSSTTLAGSIDAADQSGEAGGVPRCSQGETSTSNLSEVKRTPVLFETAQITDTSQRHNEVSSATPSEKDDSIYDLGDDSGKESDMKSPALSRAFDETSSAVCHNIRKRGKKSCDTEDNGMDKKHNDSTDFSSDYDSGNSARSTEWDTSREYDSIEHMSLDRDHIEDGAQSSLAQRGTSTGAQGTAKALSSTIAECDYELSKIQRSAAFDDRRGKNPGEFVEDIYSPKENIDGGELLGESESARPEETHALGMGQETPRLI